MKYQLIGIQQTSGFYKLESDDFLNNYYVVSDASTCQLMASPEVVAYDSYLAMVPATMKALCAMRDMNIIPDEVNIMTILRGGLNYPLEECCHNCGIKVPNINFLSCERIIKDGLITGLDVKYQKLHPVQDATIMIGDIIASGDTLRVCLWHVIEYFKAQGGSIRRIVFFTIGGTKAFTLMETFTKKIREFWPDFEGFYCVFYEGVFTVYEDHGVTGVNIPNIDFGWKGGIVSPEFREYVLRYDHAPALLEKCIIYDGGARRYELEVHFEEVLNYWKDLLKASATADFDEFIAEKVGHEDVDYKKWLEINHYPDSDEYISLYNLENQYIEKLSQQSLTELCEMRIEQFRQFINNK